MSSMVQYKCTMRNAFCIQIHIFKGKNIMAHGNHESKERMRIFEEDSILNRYLGKKSMNTLEKEKY